MRKLVTGFALMVMCGNLYAEVHIWTLGNGKTFEAEFVTVVGEKVILKNRKGKQLKLSTDDFSKEDLSYIELQLPPKLDIEFSKTTTQRVLPDSLSDLPRSLYYDYSVRIKQTSTKLYGYDLTAEVFVYADEIDGDKKILLDYKKETFQLTEGSKSTFQIKGERSELLDYIIGGQRRGEKFGGYVIVITDTRGEVIAYKSSSENVYDHVENLRKVPVKKTFDENCNRCFPTSPKRFY